MRGVVQKASETTHSFSRSGYVLLRMLVPRPMRSFLYEYVLKSARAGRLGLGDSGVPNTPNIYGDPFMDSLLELFVPRMEAESGKRLFPTYSYFRLYKHGDVLKRHQDRPSCEISATLNLGYAAPEAWPIWLDVGGERKSVSLEPGDALLYKGIEIPHWRERFAGEHSAQVFLHYVDQGGPYKAFAFDRRESLSTSPVASRILEQLMKSARE